jgi:hypothetical protein
MSENRRRRVRRRGTAAHTAASGAQSAPIDDAPVGDAPVGEDPPRALWAVPDGAEQANGPDDAEQPEQQADDRPEYETKGNARDAFLWLREEIGQGELSNHYMRGGQLVHTATADDEGYVTPAHKGDENGTMTVRPVTSEHLQVQLALRFRIFKHHVVRDRKTKKIIEEWDEEVLFPAKGASMTITAAGSMQLPNLRPLRGVTHTPIVRRDGSILSTPGYDTATGLLYAPTVNVPTVSARPNRSQLRKAVALLRGMIDEFSWAGPHDEANYLGLLLTPVLRELCPPPYKVGAIMAPTGIGEVAAGGDHSHRPRRGVPLRSTCQRGGMGEVADVDPVLHHRGGRAVRQRQRHPALVQARRTADLARLHRTSARREQGPGPA